MRTEQHNIPHLIAWIRCLHDPRGNNRPCGRCTASVAAKLREIDESLVALTARAMVKQQGYDCPPTPLTYSAALTLLGEIVPAIQART
jgi:hypothetical protein